MQIRDDVGKMGGRGSRWKNLKIFWESRYSSLKWFSRVLIRIDNMIKKWSNMVKYGQIWSNMVKYGQIWSNMVKNAKILSKIVKKYQKKGKKW